MIQARSNFFDGKGSYKFPVLELETNEIYGWFMLYFLGEHNVQFYIHRIILLTYNLLRREFGHNTIRISHQQNFMEWHKIVVTTLYVAPVVLEGKMYHINNGKNSEKHRPTELFTFVLFIPFSKKKPSNILDETRFIQERIVGWMRKIYPQLILHSPERHGTPMTLMIDDFQNCSRK